MIPNELLLETPVEQLEAIAMRFKELRLATNVRQEDLAKRSGVGIATIRRFRGRREYFCAESCATDDLSRASGGCGWGSAGILSDNDEGVRPTFQEAGTRKELSGRFRPGRCQRTICRA